MEFYKKLIYKIAILFVVLYLRNCESLTDDLLPSDADRRGSNPGVAVGEVARDLKIKIDGSSSLLSEFMAKQEKNGMLLYFTMWCSVCAAHADHMLAELMPENADHAAFVLVDYVSDNATAAAAAIKGAGLDGVGFSLASDANRELLDYFNAGMSVTVVLDADRRILYNASYGDGKGLATALRKLGQ